MYVPGLCSQILIQSFLQQFPEEDIKFSQCLLNSLFVDGISTFLFPDLVDNNRPNSLVDLVAEDGILA